MTSMRLPVARLRVAPATVLLAAIPNWTGWDVSGLQFARHMFRGGEGGTPDISGWGLADES